MRPVEPRKRSKMVPLASTETSMLVVFHEEKAIGRFPWVDYVLLLKKSVNQRLSLSRCSGDEIA